MAAIYKNAPLVRTAFEARFFGDLSIEAKRHLFQQNIRAEFPNLYVPNANSGKAPALQHYQFRKDDGSEIVGLAVNSFTYTVINYPGFEQFNSDLERVWKSFEGTFEIPIFTRLGLRYTNHLPIVRDDNGNIPFSKYISATSQTAGLIEGKIFDIDLNVARDLSDGHLRIRLKNEKQKSGIEILLLDLDYFLARPIEPKDRPGFVNSAHNHIEEMFLRLISDEYKQVMNGGE